MAEETKRRKSRSSWLVGVWKSGGDEELKILYHGTDRAKAKSAVEVFLGTAKGVQDVRVFCVSRSASYYVTDLQPHLGKAL